jgi:GNAT superfamily N-acetyltransferase
MPNIHIRPTTSGDADFINRTINRLWGADFIVVKGKVYYPADQPGYIAEEGNETMGVINYVIADGDCQVLCLNSVVEGRGVGSMLVEKVKDTARQNSCRRLWLITTNDNTTALRFYQKMGFQLAALHRGAVERSRQIKPQIPLLGNEGIPICDEIELEMSLKS